MSLSVWLSFMFVSVMQTINSGSLVSILITTSLQNGTKEAILLIPGAVLGDFILIIIAFAITTILEAISVAGFDFIKIFGGLYLITIGFIAISNWINASIKDSYNINRNNNFSKIMISSILNHKIIWFFISLLPKFIYPLFNMSYNVQFLILSFTYLMTGIFIYTIYVISLNYLLKILNPIFYFFVLIFSIVALILNLIFIFLNLTEIY